MRLSSIVLLLALTGEAGGKGRFEIAATASPTMVDVADVVAVRVEDIGDRELLLLEQARPAGDQMLTIEGGGYELRTTTVGLVLWMDGFLLAARKVPGAQLGRWRSMAMCLALGGATRLQQSSMWRLSRVEDGSARKRGPSGMTETLWTPEEDDEPDSVESTLDRLNWRMVRRAIVRATAVLEATTVDVRRRDRVADGIRAGVRLLDMIEVGGGYRRVHGVVPATGAVAGAQPEDRVRAGDVVYHSVVFARAGIDVTRWRNRTLALPIAVDLGAGTSVDFHLRIHTGVRIRASDRLYLGINAWNPTYTIYRSTSLLAGAPRWSSQSTIEAGYIF